MNITTVAILVVTHALAVVGGLLIARKNSQHLEAAVAEVKAVAAKAIADVKAEVSAIKAKL